MLAVLVHFTPRFLTKTPSSLCELCAFAPLREKMGINRAAGAGEGEKMANKRFWHVIPIVIPAIALVFGTMVISCGIGSLGGGGFTLTDIPSQYNGKYAALAGANLKNTKLAYVGYQSFNGKDKNSLCRISGGRVVIPMWTVDGSTKIDRYSGSDTLTMVTVSIYDSEKKAKEDPQNPAASNIFMSVNFSKGSADASWKKGMARESGESLLDQVLKSVR